VRKVQWVCRVLLEHRVHRVYKALKVYKVL